MSPKTCTIVERASELVQGLTADIKNYFGESFFF